MFAAQDGVTPSSVLYAEDVFSAYTYTGTGAAQTITNGIDLAGKGGMVWTKYRNSAVYTHVLQDTARGAGKKLDSSATGDGLGTDAQAITAFNSNGFSLGTRASLNESAGTFISWTFRKAAKFFDVVTYTGNGANRTIAHSLGQAPGMILVKRTDSIGSWMVYHRSLANTNNLVINTTAAEATNATAWNSTTADASVFSLGTHADVNTNAATYVAYLFAHDTATDGLIQCGSFTTDGSGNATVTLGWEPQYLMFKTSSTTGNWKVGDTARNMSVTDRYDLFPNSSTSESANGIPISVPTATGFNIYSQATSATHIYLAIRRPNKPPTLGTQVYAGTSMSNAGGTRTITAGLTPDLVINKTTATASLAASWYDRLRGQKILDSNGTGAEYGAAAGIALTMDGISYTSSGDMNPAYPSIDWFFKRAPGVFDEVCYTGDGTDNRQVSHSLGAAPEFVITKHRGVAWPWHTYHSGLGSTRNAILFADSAAKVTNSDAFSPTGAAFTSAYFLQSAGYAAYPPNANGYTYVAYLFATKAGISKVGSYTGNGGTAGGNGSGQTINCGFTTGARFILVKCTSHTSSWIVADTTRGIVAGNDPTLALDSTATELTGYDVFDPDTSGFIVNQVASGSNSDDLNVTGRTYIYLAFA